MSKRNRGMSAQDSVYIRTLTQKCGIAVCEILKNPRKYPRISKYPKSTIYRHAKKNLDDLIVDNRHKNKGRPRKSNPRIKRIIKREITQMRNSHGTFSSAELQTACGLNNISNSTFRRILKDMGYNWRNTRRKGKLLEKDLKERLKYCRKMERLELNTPNFWCEGIALYVDGVGFEYKSNPYEHAKSLGSREWRMKSEGLQLNCTSKGRKEGKTNCQFMVGMTYEQGVVLCVPLVKRITGEYYSEIIKNNLRDALVRSKKSSKRILQDGDPSQNSKRARDELFRQNIRLFSIPARSPDLNPIENLFNQVRVKIKTDSLQKQLQRETKEAFIQRVTGLLLDFNKTRIDNLILSMPKRVKMVLANKGLRIKY